MSAPPFAPEQVAADLLRALRGARSQVQFARRIGAGPTVPYTWESGRRFPPASTFLQAASKVGVDPEPALAGFFGGAWTAGAEEGDRVVRLLRAAVGAASQTELAAQAGLGRQAIGRWL